MAKEGTENFLRLMNEANAAIAARIANETKKAGGGDPVRLAMEIERRDKADGPLRARPHRRSRHKGVLHVFGYTDMS